MPVEVFGTAIGVRGGLRSAFLYSDMRDLAVLTFGNSCYDFYMRAGLGRSEDDVSHFCG